MLVATWLAVVLPPPLPTPLNVSAISQIVDHAFSCKNNVFSAFGGDVPSRNETVENRESYRSISA